jgi:hypothetical protein
MTCTHILRATTAVALLALPLAAAPARSQTQEQPAPSDQPQTQEQQAPSGQQNTAQNGEQGQPQENALVATVGDKEIRSADVMRVIGLLPEPMRAQPPELLVPLAVDQIVLRELILQEARAENLQDDPEVAELAQQSAQAGEEDAMVQIWVQRALESRVTDERVQQVYDQLTAGAGEGQEVPPLEEVRPQIEQQARQQALGEIRAELEQGADIVFYDPSGNPLDPNAAPQGEGARQSPEDDNAAQDGAAPSEPQN